MRSDEYIKKQTVYEILNKMGKINNQHPGGLISDTVEVCIRCVSDNVRLAHEEDVVPVRHGKWVDTDPDTPNCSNRKAGMSFYCSVCGHPAGKYKHSTYKFCPWCGARMDGDGDV